MKRFLKNAWYMAAWAGELHEGFLTRRLLDTPTLLYRTSDGNVVAMHDYCPHRFAPLSRGKLTNEGVQCGYHGLKFNHAGRCTGGFYRATGTSNLSVRTFPVVEQDTIIWLWPGEPAKADPATIPRFHYLSDPDFKTIDGLSMVKAHYELLADNLLDLSHIEFLHPAFCGVLQEGKYSASTEGETIQSNWWAANVPPTGAIKLWWPESSATIDHWLDMRWNAPASMLLHVGATHPGKPREVGLYQPSVHILTPETDTRTHYFWNAGMPRDNHLDMKEIGRLFALSFDEEDAPMIEAVQSQMGTADLLDLNPVLLRTDAGAIQARRILHKRLALENHLTV
jgi:vanillate O-demethylase monooxygenase subunit